MAQSRAYQVLQFVRRAGTATTHDVMDEFNLHQKVASAVLCDLRLRNQLKIIGKTPNPGPTGRPLNIWSLA